jgi:hypothetical protein
MSFSRDAVQLGDLLATTLGAVAQAQDRLDAHALARREAYEAAAADAARLPPLWYTVRSVAVELELSAALTTSAQRLPGAEAQLLCRTLDPTVVSLFGFRAAAGLRVRLIAGPREPEPGPMMERK